MKWKRSRIAKTIFPKNEKFGQLIPSSFKIYDKTTESRNSGINFTKTNRPIDEKRVFSTYGVGRTEDFHYPSLNHTQKLMQ